MTTTVINIRDAPPGWESKPEYVYIGRPCTRGHYELPGSIFANPYTLNRDGTRIVCIRKFQYRIQHHCPDIFVKAKEELHGKVLVCWCKPAPCHGDVLIAIADGHLEFKGAIHAER